MARHSHAWARTGMEETHFVTLYFADRVELRHSVPRLHKPLHHLHLCNTLSNIREHEGDNLLKRPAHVQWARHKRSCGTDGHRRHGSCCATDTPTPHYRRGTY